MADSADTDEVFWVDPEKRGIIPLNKFHVSRSLKKRLVNGRFHFTVDACFNRIVGKCAERQETWINPTIKKLYSQLNAAGFAHSIEVWGDDGLSGGLYGVCIGGAFFGESMYSAQKDGSKLALVALVARLRIGGFSLLDTQFKTDHLASMGAIEIGKTEYQERLSDALEIDGDFFRLPLEVGNHELWQLSTQTS